MFEKIVFVVQSGVFRKEQVCFEKSGLVFKEPASFEVSGFLL